MLPNLAIANGVVSFLGADRRFQELRLRLRIEHGKDAVDARELRDLLDLQRPSGGCPSIGAISLGRLAALEPILISPHSLWNIPDGVSLGNCIRHAG